MLEGIYDRAWHMGKERGLRKYKGSYKEIWGKNECRSKKVRKVGYNRGKGL